MLHFYPKFLIRTFVLLVAVALKPLNSPLKIQISHGHQVRWSTFVLGVFTLLSPIMKDPSFQGRMYLLPPSARSGDLEFGLLLLNLTYYCLDSFFSVCSGIPRIRNTSEDTQWHTTVGGWWSPSRALLEVVCGTKGGAVWPQNRGDGAGASCWVP